MFGVSKKIAASMAELLIILAIIGILSVMYRKTVNQEAIVVKYGYKTLMNDMMGFAATETNSYEQKFSSAPICEQMFRMVNSLGEKNCRYSVLPVIPNLTTTSGMRFFGLEQTFQNHDGMGEKSVFIQVDLDGMLGKNKFEEDIWPFELMQSGRIRPTGSANKKANNIALDSALLAINASYVPEGVVSKTDFLTIGNRISYAEAQCLSGNIFPYRDAYPPYKLQMCIENTDVRNAIDAFNHNFIGTRPTITDQNADGITTSADRDEIIRKYRLQQATNNTICNGIYTNDNGIAKGITPILDEGVTRCKYCYKIAYVNDYCATDTDIFEDPSAASPVRKKDAENKAICPEELFTDTADTTDTKIINGMCSVPEWLENIQ